MYICTNISSTLLLELDLHQRFNHCHNCVNPFLEFVSCCTFVKVYSPRSSRLYVHDCMFKIVCMLDDICWPD